MNYQLKPLVDKNILLIQVLAVVLFYKLYKFIISYYLGIHDYYLLEYYHSFYRFFGFLIGLFWILRHFERPKALLTSSNYWLVFYNLIIFFPLMFLLRYLNYDISFNLNQFLHELAFCPLVGLFEEFIFRGLILTVFFHYFNKPKAIIFSSLIFMLWHLDVTCYWKELLTIFLGSIYLSLNFTSGISLMALSFFHFLWDLIMFGFVWKIPANQSMNFYYEYSRIILLIGFILFIYFYNKKKNQTTNSSREASTVSSR